MFASVRFISICVSVCMCFLRISVYYISMDAYAHA
jgi:hypothetical protein